MLDMFIRTCARARFFRSRRNGRTAVHREIEFRGKSFHSSRHRGGCKFSASIFRAIRNVSTTKAGKACMPKIRWVFAPTCQSCQGRICRRSAERNCYRGKIRIRSFIGLRLGGNGPAADLVPDHGGDAQPSDQADHCEALVRTGDLSGIAFKLMTLDFAGSAAAIAAIGERRTCSIFWHRQFSGHRTTPAVFTARTWRAEHPGVRAIPQSRVGPGARRRRVRKHLNTFQKAS